MQLILLSTGLPCTPDVLTGAQVQVEDLQSWLADTQYRMVEHNAHLQEVAQKFSQVQGALAAKRQDDVESKCVLG